MTDTWKKVLIPNLPYLLFVYLFDKLCQAVRLAPGLDASEKFLHLSQGFTEAFSSAAPSLHLLDLLAGIAGAIIVRLAVYAKGKNARKYRKGIEYGSARWGTAADIAPYVDPVPDWNIPLTQTEKLTMSSRLKNPKYARNKNILIIGGSGSGKTRFFVKPSLMQMHSSYVVTDPKGQLLSEVGTMLRRGAPKLDENGKPMRDARGKVIYEPYRIKVLNTINFKKSMKYNPFAYIRSEKDILKLVNVIIANTKGDGEKSSEDFWVKAERLLYCALIGYIWYEAEPEEKNFLTLLELINASEAREDDEEFQSPVDILFAKLEKEHPDHFAVKQYRKFKLAAGVVCSKRLLNQAVGKSLTVHDVTLEYPGQIIKLSAYDKPASLGVTITKRGNAQVMAGQSMRYDLTVANTSNVPLESFFWHDKIPYDVARPTTLTTGTYSARLNYRILYKTNCNASYQVLASNLLTSNNYSFSLNAIPMQAGEVVTDIYFDFGKVPVGFQSVVNPTLSVMVNGNAVNGYQMVNRADVGGKYQGTWQTATASWVTIIRRLWNTPTLPKTGY